jgi:uncharacterized membrane protein
MSTADLIRLGGLAAMIAGILRRVNSVLPNSISDVAIALLYLLTDIFILFGMMGLYGFQHKVVQPFLHETRLQAYETFALRLASQNFR